MCYIRAIYVLDLGVSKLVNVILLMLTVSSYLLAELQWFFFVILEREIWIFEQRIEKHELEVVITRTRTP